ncbi:MAG: aldehyde dehydrogenase family protein [Solirubrobacteraceae bacterium]
MTASTQDAAAFTSDWHARRRDLSLEGRGIVGGRLVDAAEGKSYVNVSPIDGAALCHVNESGSEQIDDAVRDARRCFAGGTWASADAKSRKKVLSRLAELVRSHHEELALLETLDTGRPINDSLNFDIPRVADCFDWYSEMCDKRYGETLSTANTNVITIVREPLGVVGVIVPWNFPLLMAAWKIAPALAIGNSVVVKPDEKSPLTVIRLAQLALDAGLPAGAFNVCPGHGSPAGEALARHMDVDCVAFTGSVDIGRRLQEYAGQSNMKSVWVETGGKGPQIVFDDASDLDTIASSVAGGVFYNQGQVCSAGTRLIVQEDVHDELVRRVVSIAESMRLDDPLRSETELGAVISEQQLKRIERFCETASGSRATIVTGGRRADVVPGGTYFEPTVVDDVGCQDALFQEEVFGPVLSVTSFKDADDAIAKANDSRYALTSAVWSDNIHTAMKVARAVKAGTVWVNTFNRNDLGVPFGGFKQSGHGRAKSLHAIEKYSDLKSTWIEWRA